MQTSGASHRQAVQPRENRARRTWALAAALAAQVAAGAQAQDLATIATPREPLVLASSGSFFVGGERRAQTHEQLGPLSSPGGGHRVVEQMYVQFMVPARQKGAPLVFLHGSFLHAKTWETTPDGRMGWGEQFVRMGHPVYLADQVNRGRSGFDVAVFNEVKAGTRKPSDLPDVFGYDEDNGMWAGFRVGLKEGSPFADTQFPYQAMAEFAKQGAPEIYYGPGDLPATYRDLSELAKKLGGAVFVGHSIGAGHMLEAAAVSPVAIKAIVNLEGPCGTFAPLSDDQVRAVSGVPVLVVYGDHLTTDTNFGFSYYDQMKQCEAFVQRVNAIGGKAKLLLLPDIGIKGNSHMLMMDRNGPQIAKIVERWITENAK